MDNSVPDDVKNIIGNKKLKEVSIKLKYKNWRGEVGEREIIPISIYFGETDFHKEKQWLMKVYDLDKKDYRDYALKDIEEWVKFP
mgnify:CR=1 FL=1